MTLIQDFSMKGLFFLIMKIYFVILVAIFFQVGNFIWTEMYITDPLQKPHQTKYVDFVKILNYPTQEFNVTTEDGYIINLVRIQEQVLPPVLMYFGLNCAIEVFSVNYEDKSPTFYIANQGYDVWLVSNRGTKYSSKHVNLTMNDQKFWEFSWQEMAEYDFRAAFDFIYDRVGKKKISTIGFSQGTTIILAALSEHPEYQQKITQTILMGPTANIINHNSFGFGLGILIGGAPLLKRYGFKMLVDQYNILYYSTKFMQDLALYILSLITDEDVSVIHKERFPYFMATYPGGTSLQVYDHWQQLASETPLFRKYDYRNTTLNLEKYGTEQPPEYDLTKIKIPIHLFIGTKDRLSSPKDAQILYNIIKQSSVNATMQTFNGGHLYFAIGKDTAHLERASQLLKDQIINQV